MHTVVVVGEGLLANFVCEQLAGSCKVLRQINMDTNIPEAAQLVMVLQDERNVSLLREAEGALQLTGIPWLSGSVAMDEGIIGPLVRAGTPGCSQCADMRHQTTGHNRHGISDLLMRLTGQQEDEQDVWTSRTGLLQMAYLLTAEAMRVLQGSPAYSEGRIYVLNLKTLQSSLHPFLPDPLCVSCGSLPEDSCSAATISLQPSPKISPDSYRCRPISDLVAIGVMDYVDERTGLLNGIRHDFISPFANTIVNLPLFGGAEVAGGRAFSYMESQMAAILEGLERCCGLSPRGKHTVINASYHQLGEQALDPVTVGLYTEEQYAQEDFPFQPFDPDAQIGWVWGYSLVQEHPILVPEALAYYSKGYGDSFVIEASSGCAIGGSLEEAIFYGILEVVERDSFLLTWYAQLPVPRLDPYSANDEELRLMIDRLQTVTGHKVHLFNMTMENGIPSIGALALNSQPLELNRANLICAAGAHLDPVRAAKSAIHELANMIPVLNEMLEEYHENGLEMFHDSSLVQQMLDHPLLYSLPQAQERLHFLLDDDDRAMQTFDEAFTPLVRHADLTDDLKDLIQIFNRLNLDIIVVEQSNSETLRNGLHCVKVLIPGMLPMTFGHQLTRVTGLDRVLKVPLELGYTNRLLTLDELNPYPHPFP